jgi:hypothetical protein
MRRLLLVLFFLVPLLHADELFDGKTLNGWVVEGAKTVQGR